MEQTAKQMPQMKKELDAQIAEMRKQLAALGANQDNNAKMDALLKQGAQNAAAEHKQRLAEWEKQ
jgi:predicted component of type VI protein secretion system